jgi:hypothetical protein
MSLTYKLSTQSNEEGSAKFQSSSDDDDKISPSFRDFSSAKHILKNLMKIGWVGLKKL